MIPRTIHCCWLGGGRKTALAEKCRASWERFAPGWRVKEWDRESFMHLDPPAFARDAVAAGKWAFAADWLRFAALHREGGVYFDYDMELVAPFDAEAPFVAGQFLPGGRSGPEPAAMALEKGSAVAEAMLGEYAAMPFGIKETAGEILSRVLARGGLSLAVAEKEVFSPVDTEGRLHITEKTVGIHRCAMSWAGRPRRVARWMSWHGMRRVVDALLAVRRVSGSVLKRLCARRGEGGV